MPIIMLRNINQPKLCNGTRLSVKKNNDQHHISKNFDRAFQRWRCPPPANSYDSNRYVISISEITIPNSIGICNHDHKSTGTMFRIGWLIFSHWMLLTWTIICYLLQSQKSRQSFYLHGNWNYQEYCISTSIGKLNILEICIFFFFPI